MRVGSYTTFSPATIRGYAVYNDGQVVWSVLVSVIGELPDGSYGMWMRA